MVWPNLRADAIDALQFMAGRVHNIFSGTKLAYKCERVFPDGLIAAKSPMHLCKFYIFIFGNTFYNKPRQSPPRTKRPAIGSVLWLFSLIIASWLVPVYAAGCLSGKQLTGVNLAGAEFNAKKGAASVVGRDYIYPDEKDLRYFRSIGVEAVRLPVRWERLQPQFLGPLNSKELALIDAVLGTAAQQDLCVILDIHNYGGYEGRPIGSEAVPITAFLDLWHQLGERYRDNAHIAFGLMNEPSALSIVQWKGIAQQTVDEIRKSGAKNLILASGGRWSGAHEWSKRIGETSNAEAFADLRDPANHLLIEIHQYADFDYSGTHHETCVSPEKMQVIMDGVSRWAASSKHQLFLGEFGVPPTEDCLRVLDTMLKHMRDNKKSWQGWTYWAAGRWWGKYPLSIQPRGDQDAPQTEILRKYLAE